MLGMTVHAMFQATQMCLDLDLQLQNLLSSLLKGCRMGAFIPNNVYGIDDCNLQRTFRYVFAICFSSFFG